MAITKRDSSTNVLPINMCCQIQALRRGTTSEVHLLQARLRLRAVEVARFLREDASNLFPVGEGFFSYFNRYNFYQSFTRRIGSQDFKDYFTRLYGYFMNSVLIFPFPRLLNRRLRNKRATRICILFKCPISALIVPRNGRATRCTKDAFKGYLFPIRCPQQPFLVGPLIVRRVPMMAYYQGSVRVDIADVGRLMPLLRKGGEVRPIVQPHISHSAFHFCKDLTKGPFRSTPRACVFTMFLGGFRVAIYRMTMLFNFFLIMFINASIRISSGCKVITQRVFIRRTISRLVDFFFMGIRVVRTVLPAYCFKFMINRNR